MNLDIMKLYACTSINKLYDRNSTNGSKCGFFFCCRYVLVACHNVISRKHDDTFYKITRNFYNGFLVVQIMDVKVLVIRKTTTFDTTLG